MTMDDMGGIICFFIHGLCSQKARSAIEIRGKHDSGFSSACRVEKMAMQKSSSIEVCQFGIARWNAAEKVCSEAFEGQDKCDD
jgi:hypothetical protein